MWAKNLLNFRSMLKDAGSNNTTGYYVYREASHGFKRNLFVDVITVTILALPFMALLFCHVWDHQIHGKLLSNVPIPIVFSFCHDDVIKWKHFPRYWPFVRGIHRSPHKGQWRGALMFTLICARINGWVNNREAGDLRRYRAHYDVIVMIAES